MNTKEKVIMIRTSISRSLVDEINEAVENGYELQGNVWMDQDVICQLMVLKEEQEKVVPDPSRVAKLVRSIIADVQDMQDNGCSDGCHNIAFNLERMYAEALKG